MKYEEHKNFLGQTYAQSLEAFKKQQRDPTSMWYYPDAELLQETQFLENLYRHHNRLWQLIRNALENRQPNPYE
jgi:hypothetical protein